MKDQFRDRREAGRLLAEKVERFASSRPVVLALPRGGVPVAFEVAERLRAPLDVLVVRKLGAPGHDELAMGAIASGGAMVINREVLETLHIPRDLVAERALSEGAEVARRDALYRDNLPILEVAGRTVLLIDDGLATGATMKAAVQALRQYEPARIVCGVPVAAPQACELLREVADEVVYLLAPSSFRAVGQWYENFDQTSDREVIELLARHRRSAWAQGIERRRAS